MNAGRRRDQRFSRWYTWDYGDCCRYCGACAESIDHAYPISLLAIEAEIYGWKSVWDMPFDLRRHVKVVPCCSECNNHLGNKRIFGIKNRKKSVNKYLKKKYKKYLQKIEWSDDELLELGCSLRTHVKNANGFSVWIKHRIHNTQV